MFSLFRRRKSSRRRSAHAAARSARRAAFIEQLEARLLLVSDTPDWLSISSGAAPEGGTLIVTVKWGGIDPQASLQIGVSPLGMAYPGIDYNCTFSFSGTVPGSGSMSFPVQFLDDKGFANESQSIEGVSVGAQLYEPDGGEKTAGAQEVIAGSSTPTNCTCSCSCGNVEPTVTKSTGRPLVNTGQGGAPPDHFYVGDQRPHPIATVNDTLSSTVSQASDIKVQTVLTDLSGSVLYTASPVYYSPAGYTAGQQVQFSQQLDGAGLADGTYGYTSTVTEEYPNGGASVLRTYSDFVQIHNLDASPYGSGWTLKNVDRLVPQAGGASLEDGSGNVYYFPVDYAGQYDPPVNRPDIASLVKNGDGTFTLTYRDAGQEIFSSAGLLTASIDKNNNKTTYSWNGDNTLASVTDQAGRQTTFTYTSGQLTSVTDFAGRVTSYGFTGGQLTTITLPDPGHGETQHVTTLGYDGTTGMLTTITDAGGATTLHYNNFREVTSITEPDGTSIQYAAPDSMSLVDTSTGVGTQSNPAPLVYTANVSGSVTDGNGHTSRDTTGQYGEITSTTDATGTNTTSDQYNSAGQVTQITQPPITVGGANLVTSLHYDSNGNLIERDLPDGTSETWVYNQTFNEPTKYVDPAGRETDYTLDPANGDVLTVTQVGKNGDPNLVTTYTYTANPTAQGQTPGGLVATMVDPRGIETEFFYNTHGLMTSTVYAVGTPDQASVAMTYDQNDNPASYVNELSQTTLLVYDNSNRKVEEQDPPPDPSQPNVRPTLTWSYDTRGNMVQSVNALSQATSYVYGPGSDGDEPDLDKMIQPDPAGGTNYTITTYGHDNAENVTSITDPMSRIESIGLDADNRQTSVTLPNPVGGGTGGPTASVVYNALGFATQQFDFAGHETDNTYNWRGQVLTTTGPAPTQGAQRPVETFTYNNDGQVLTDQNPLLATTQDVYDSFGRLTEQILPDPDGNGPLTSPTLHWTYDADSNVASFQDANGNLYTYTYNNRNELVRENDPSPDGGHTPGPVWQWVYDTAESS